MSKNAIVLIIDGLGTGCLGPYGISTGETETFNRLASESIVVDHAMADACDSAMIYRSMLQGGHAGYPDEWYSDRLSLPRMAEDHGIHSIWFSNQGSLKLPGANEFRRQISFSQSLPTDNKLASTIDDMWMARFFAESVEAIAQSPSGSNLAWIHCPGMTVAWDAPHEFRMRIAGPDDPDPPMDAQPPNLAYDHDDPDKRFGIECAYAGQVAALDLLLGAYFDAIESLPGETLLILAGHRGYPLGQHNVIGLENATLQSEMVHVPLFAKYPSVAGSETTLVGAANHFRLQSLIQPSEIFTTVTDWFQMSSGIADSIRSLGTCLTDPAAERQELAISVNGNELAIRTQFWFARCFDEPAEEGTDWCQLYLKPDDRWNLNDIADRCPQVVADLRLLYAEVRRSLVAGNLNTVEIPESLKAPVE